MLSRRSLIAVALALSLTIHPRPLAAQPTAGGPLALLADLNPGTQSSVAQRIQRLGVGALFNSGPYDYDLTWWFTDGTPAGTAAIPGLIAPCYYVPSSATLAGVSYFCGRDAEHGEALWRSDGSAAGTRPAVDILPASAGLPYSFTNFDDTLLFFTGTEGGSFLWRYDGRAAPTRLTTSAISQTSELVELGGAVYFFASTNGYQSALWRSDASPAGTLPITESIFDGPHRLSTAGGKLFFSDGIGNEYRNLTRLWSSDGTAQGTQMLIDTQPAQPQSAATPAIGSPITTPVIGTLVPFGERMLVQIGSGATPATMGLWVSDGTPGGTLRLSAELTTTPLIKGRSFYVGTPSGLYRSNGTLAGTTRVAEGAADEPLLTAGSTIMFRRMISYEQYDLWAFDEPLGAARSLARLGTSMPVQVGQRIFFKGTDAAYGSEPWVSDGTPAGTGPLADLFPGPDSSITDYYYYDYAELGNWRIVFSANDGISGRELFVTDGTPAGTRLLADTISTPAGSDPLGLSAVDGRLFFIAHTRTGGAYSIYRADSAGPSAVAELRDETYVVADMPPSSYSLQVQAGSLGGRYIALVGRRYKLDDSYQGSFHEASLWVSDGTGAGTSLLLRANAFSDQAFWLALTSEQAFFATADYDNSGIRLYATEGISESTRLLREFDKMGDQVVLSDTLYFLAATADQEGLWRSDGTAAGTELVAPLAGIFAYDYGLAIVSAGGLIYITSTGPVSNALWRSDGTAAGTVALRGPQRIDRLVGGGDLLFFAGGDFGAQPKLWVSDGSQAGTVGLAQINASEQMLASAQQLYVVEDDYLSSQFVLRKVDAVSRSSTAVFRTPSFQLLPGQPYQETKLKLLSFQDGALLFSVSFSAQAGLWRSDGTPEGTYRVRQDLLASEVAEFGGRLSFSASDGAYGQELWASVLGIAITAPTLLGATVGGSALLSVALINGGDLPELAAATLMTLTVELDPQLSYLGSEGPQPSVEGNLLSFSLPRGGPLSRNLLGLRLGVPADAPLGTRYPVRIKVDGREQLVELMAAHQSYLPLLFR